MSDRGKKVADDLRLFRQFLDNISSDYTDLDVAEIGDEAALLYKKCVKILKERKVMPGE